MRPSRCLVWLAAALPGALCSAQVMQSPGTMPDGRRIQMPGIGPHSMPQRPPGANNQGPQTTPPATVQTGASSGPSAGPGMGPSTPGAGPAAIVAPGSTMGSAQQVPPSLLDKPAQPAKVKVSDGRLSVSANNSSLSDILHDLSASSGMTVDGFQKDQRVFGIYGPGDPREILSELLDGAGYNFLMVGQTDGGMPREILLTARTNAPLTPPQSISRQEEDEESINPPQEEVNPVLPPIAPPPGDQPQRPRSPQEMMQELQRMRQQQLQQQQQSGQPQGQPQSQQP